MSTLMTILNAATIFAWGMVAGISILTVYMRYQVKKLRKDNKSKEEIVDEFKKLAEKLQSKETSIKERLLQAQEIAKQQVEIKSMAEAPSKNALHSRHKNGLIGDIAELERQKLALLRSILDDGLDPTITVITSAGNREELLLSTYVAEAELSLNEYSPVSKTPETPDTPRQVGKFTVHKGGKNDDGTGH